MWRWFRTPSSAATRQGGVPEAEARPFDLRAAVHDHTQPGRAGRRGRRLVDHPELHPDRPRAQADRRIHARSDMLGGAEQIDHVQRCRLVEIGGNRAVVQALAGKPRIDRSDVVAMRQQELRDLERRARRRH